MNATTNTLNRRSGGKPAGYHAGDAIIRRLMINLATNNANPDAIEAAKDAKDIAAASTKANPAATECEAPEPPSSLATVRNAVARGLVNRYSKDANGMDHKPKGKGGGQFTASGGGGAPKSEAIHDGTVSLARRKTQIHTPEFKAWFGDWEAAPDGPPAGLVSQVVDSRGKPLVVFSGQPRHFEAAEDRVERNELPFGVLFATSDRDVAAKYAGSHPNERQIRKRVDLRDYEPTDEQIAAAEKATRRSWDDLSWDESVEALRASGIDESKLPVEVEREPQTGFSLGKRGKTYRLYLNIKQLWNMDEFDEDEWRDAFLHADGDEIPDSREAQDDMIAGAMGLTAGSPESNDDADDDGGYYDHLSDLWLPTLDIQQFIEQRWPNVNSGMYLMGAISESPSAQAAVLFPDAAEYLVEKHGYDGASHTDTEVGGTTYIPFHPSQIKSATGNSGDFAASDDRIAYSFASRVRDGLASVMRYRHTDDAPGQRDLFTGTMRRKPATQSKLKWITLKAKSGEGTVHVQLDEDGTIVTGPQALTGQNVQHITPVPKAPDWFGGKKPSPPPDDVQFSETEPDNSATDSPAASTHTLRRGQHGGPVGATTIDVAQLKIDPKRFQYKISGIDPTTGTNAELKKVKQYNPMLGGQLLVWQDPADKQTYVINGHHRYELASRSPRGDGTPFDGQMSVYYIDAKDAQEARAHGALTNIAEGRGTAVDAAKFLRDTGGTAEDFAQHGVSLSGGIASSALHLKNLSPTLFQKLTNGAMTEGRALAIAKYLPNQDGQDQLYKYIERREAEKGTSKNFTDGKVAEMARSMASAKPVKTASGGMFDDFFDSYPVEQRADIADHIRKNLSSEHRTFATAASERRQGMLEATGTNQLDVEGNRERAHSAASDLEEFDHRANAAGHPIAHALDTYAEQLFNDPKKRSAILGEALKHIRQVIATPGDRGGGSVNPQRSDSGGRTDSQPTTAVNKFSRLAAKVRVAVMRYSYHS